MGIYQTKYFDEEQNDKHIFMNIDLLEEKREMSSKRIVEYQ